MYGSTWKAVVGDRRCDHAHRSKRTAERCRALGGCESVVEILWEGETRLLTVEVDHETLCRDLRVELAELRRTFANHVADCSWLSESAGITPFEAALEMFGPEVGAELFSHERDDSSHRPNGGDMASPTAATFETSVRSVLDEIGEMLISKNRAYGNSALDPVRIFSKVDSAEQIRVRIDDKLSRLVRGSGAGEDVTLDLIGYLILLRISETKAVGE